MKILLSSESYWPNFDGGAVFEHRLVHELIDDGHEVAFVAPGKSLKPYVEHEGQSVIYRTSSGPLPLNQDYKITYRSKPTVKRAFHTFKPDVIHVHTMSMVGSNLRKLARRYDVPIVATNHLMPENVMMSFPKLVRESRWATRAFWKAIVRFHNKFDAVTSPTPSAAKLLKDYGLAVPLYDVSNGIDTDLYRPLIPKGRQASAAKKLLARFKLPPHYIVYCGRINAEKRLDMLVESFAAIMDKTDADLVLAGTGNREKALAELADKLGVSHRVHLLGRVTDPEKLALLQYAQLFAITSPAELQSISSLEALACGLPLVAVDIVALAELCHDNENGFLVELDDNQACSAALLKILSDDGLRKKFGQASRDFVVKHHSTDETRRQFLRLYRSAENGDFPNEL